MTHSYGWLRSKKDEIQSMWTFHDIPGQLQPGKKSSGFINPGVTFRKHSPNCSHSQHRSPNSFSATATASTACKGTPRVEQLLKGSSTRLHRQMRPKGRGLGAEMFHVGMMGRVDLGHGKFPLSQSIPSFYIKFRVLPWAKRTDVQNLAGFPLGK